MNGLGIWPQEAVAGTGVGAAATWRQRTEGAPKVAATALARLANAIRGDACDIMRKRSSPFGSPMLHFAICEEDVLTDDALQAVTLAQGASLTLQFSSDAVRPW
jgi:pyruvate/2-oxoacid:ferredoxin oxidoreductase alpha subunit